MKIRLSRFADGRATDELGAVTEADLDAHFLKLREAGLAVGTLAGHKSTLRAFWRWCVAEGLVESSPADVLAARRHQYSYTPVHSRAAPKADLATAVQALPAFVAHRHHNPRDLRDAALFSLAVDSSARRGELRNLRRKDVVLALEVGELLPSGRTIYRAESHGKTGPVVIRFFDDTAVYLRQWLQVMPAAAKFVFVSLRSGKRLRADAMHIGIKRLCTFAGVRPFRFHAIRKRVVTDAIAVAGDVKVGQLLANHKDQRTTQIYYNDLEESRVAEAAALLSGQRRGDGMINAFFAKTRPE